MQNHNETSLPRVAIIGRPNVGKSTLFNRFIGRRLAITDPIPGSTRDVIGRPVKIDERMTIFLLDTGGRRAEPGSELEALAIERSYAQDLSADLLLFMVEAAGLTGEDLALLEDLRRYSNKMVMVVNKCDSPEKDLLAANYHELGFKSLIFIAADHNRNLHTLHTLIADKLVQLGFKADVILSEEEQAAIAEKKPLKIAILGKPNVGKSSLANVLVGEENSIVSPVAGTTRDTVLSYFKYKESTFALLDTAGLRRKAKVNDPIEFYSTRRAESAIYDSDVALLMIDGEQGLTDQDKKIASKIVEAGKPFLFVINKCDLLTKNLENLKNKGKKNDTLSKVVDMVRFQFPVVDYVEIVLISAETKWGLEGLLQSVLRVYHQDGLIAPEIELQRALLRWGHDRSAGTMSKPGKVRSVRQLSVHPPHFSLRIRGTVDSTYVRYITNRIRQEFGYNLVPIVVEVEGAL